MITQYDKACAWLQKNLCSKYDDYTTECAGCPNSKNCFADLSHIANEKERTEVFENIIISAVEKLKNEGK